MLACAAAARAGEHPRLFFGPGELPALRAKIKREPFRGMLEVLRTCAVGRGNRGAARYNPRDTYDQSTAAQRCAFLYAVTGDDRWAKAARRLVAMRVGDSGRIDGWANRRIKGLRLYFHGSKVAMAYDWCFGAPSWDKAFCGAVSAKLKEQADVILRSGGGQQNRSPASNWQGGRFAAAGLCYLATDEPYPERDLAHCFGRVQRYLQSNLGASDASRGWNIEGLGYTYYPMGNYVGPFGVAMARRDPARDVRKTCAAARWTLWTVYAACTPAMGGIRPDFGDDNPGTGFEGTLGLAFWYCDPALHPGLVYWYDRMDGAKGRRCYDWDRGGTIWSILYHPGGRVAEKDPMTIPQWREGFVDLGGNGLFTYRNRYGDGADMVAQVYVKLRGNMGHSGPDALSFRVIGLGTAWAVGGGRYGRGNVFTQSMNTLYPHSPDRRPRTSGGSGRLAATPLSRGDGGGHLVCSIPVSNVGVRGHKRRFIADYSAAGGAEAVYVICDTSDDGRWWQLCSLEEHRVVARGNAFVVTAPNGNTMRGTVLHPSGNLRLRIGRRLRGTPFNRTNRRNSYVHLQSDDGDYLVVLTCARKGRGHPKVSASGTWSGEPKGTVTVGRFTVAIDGDAIAYPAAPPDRR
jgi:hypothetical protein